MQCFKYNQHFVAMMNIINLAKIQNVDGIVNKFTYTCPEGFVKGRLKNG